jgi:hypothetical protein
VTNANAAQLGCQPRRLVHQAIADRQATADIRSDRRIRAADPHSRQDLISPRFPLRTCLAGQGISKQTGSLHRDNFYGGSRGEVLCTKNLGAQYSFVGPKG